MLALNQDLVRPVLGNARLLLARRRDGDMIQDAIATASDEANRAMAVFDPQGKGYCAETVIFDIANLATNAIHRIRTKATGNGPVSFSFPLDVGDYTFRMRGSQPHRGGDILIKITNRVRTEPRDPGMNELLANFVKNGGRLVFFDLDGAPNDCTWLPIEEREW